MNIVEGMRYMRNLRKEVAPVPQGEDEAAIAGRASIAEYVREKRAEDPQYGEAIEVFKRRGETHRDNLTIPSSEGDKTGERFSKNAYDYIRGMVEDQRIASNFYREDGTFIKIFTPYSREYYENGFISPNPKTKDKTVIFQVWNGHRDWEDEWAPQLLEDYYLVEGKGVQDQHFPRHYDPNVPKPPIFTGVKTNDPEAYVGIDHIASFLYQETGLIQN